jgi:hypothetical protein
MFVVSFWLSFVHVSYFFWSKIKVGACCCLERFEGLGGKAFTPHFVILSSSICN